VKNALSRAGVSNYRPAMRSIPRDSSPDATPLLLREGYTFITNGCDRNDSDVFRTRLGLQRTICMRGRDCATLFYDEERFVRAGAAPSRMRKTLLGEGGVQSLDDAEHRHRKRLFMSLMSTEGIRALGAASARAWSDALARWERADEVQLLGEVHEVLTRAACVWAGVPLDEREVSTRSRDLAALVEGAGRIGTGYLRARVARIRSDRWAVDLVQRARSGRIAPDPDSALYRIASHRDLGGRLLDPDVAAVELLNVLRPTAAVAWYVVFAAHALHHHPTLAATARDDDGFLLPFAQEVRRYYPFFPFAVARTRVPFTWRGLRFPTGVRTLLDLYGIDRDPRLWDEPSAFRPERFRDGARGMFDFVPQGGGDPFLHHRCAGERVTLELIEQATAFLTRSIRYEVPEQDLSVPLAQVPTHPVSGFVMRNVRRQPSREAPARRAQGGLEREISEIP
jgi:fatty-acid peroxygenase